MTSKVTEVNYSEVAEELCAYDVLSKKEFLSLVITPFDKAY